MDTNTLQKTINKAYEALITAKEDYHAVSETVITLKSIYETKESALLLSGEIVGKNATEREAKKRKLLANELVDLQKAQLSQRVVRFNLDLAEIEVARVRALLRLEEVEVSDHRLKGES